MSSKIDDLYKLQKMDLKKAGEVLAYAFQEDPIWKKFIEDYVKKDNVSNYIFESPIQHAWKYGEVYASSRNLEGIIAWLPNTTADMTFLSLLRSGAMKTGRKMGLKASLKMAKIFMPVEKDRKKNMKDTAYNYIVIIGVNPEYQKQGFGGKLLTALFEKSDKINIPIYVETSTESNVKMYENYGFKILKEINVPILDLPMWEMKREPMNSQI